MGGIVRDFSKSSIEHLREIIRKNVDEDNEFALVDWVKDWFIDDLNINDYVNDIDTYHTNMVDKYDISSKKFDAILEKVHSVDISYADRFNCIYKGLESFNSKIMNVTALIDPSAVTLDSSKYLEILNGLEKLHTENMEIVNRQIESDDNELKDYIREVPWYESALDFIAGTGVEIVKNNLEGLCYIPFGVIGCFTDKVSNEALDDMLTNLENKYVLPNIKNNQAYYYGKATGDAITIVEGAYGMAKGFTTLLAGITITGGGAVLDCTGILAPIGTAAIAVSVPVVVAGAAEMGVSGAILTRGYNNFGDNIKMASSNNESKITNSQKSLDSNLKSNSFKDSIKNIDNNILDDMEKSGGHTLEKHVGKDEAYLRNRVKNMSDRTVGATSYTDKEITTKAVKDVFTQKADEINNWLNSSNKKNRLTLTTEHDFSVGYGIEKATGNYEVGIKKTITVLVKDNTKPLGFYILTTYPSLK